MPTILVVDDDTAIRTMLARALAQQGTVEQAADGVAALKLLGGKKYDLVLLDLHMPGVDGFAVLKVLGKKATGPNAGTPVFVVTADPSEHARVTAFHDGAVYFLSKPIRMATLTTFVQSTLKKSLAQKPG